MTQRGWPRRPRPTPPPVPPPCLPPPLVPLVPLFRPEPSGSVAAVAAHPHRAEPGRLGIRQPDVRPGPASAGPPGLAVAATGLAASWPVWPKSRRVWPTSGPACPRSFRVGVKRAPVWPKSRRVWPTSAPVCPRSFGVCADVAPGSGRRPPGSGWRRARSGHCRAGPAAYPRARRGRKTEWWGSTGGRAPRSPVPLCPSCAPGNACKRRSR